MTEFAAMRPKTQSYLRNDDDENKKSKKHKTVCCKNNLNLNIINIVQKQLNLNLK